MSTVPALISKNVGNTLTNYVVWNNILYNVKAYGATGNGTTDDTEYIQATIDAAILDGGKAVFFPHGIYKVTSLSNLSSVVLFGDNASFLGITTSISQLGSNSTNLYTSVMDYGAAGDGTTDDTASIQSAINYVFSMGGGVVFFPKGVYLCGDIILKNGVSLKGLESVINGSTSVSVLRAKAGSNVILNVNGVSSFIINYLMFDGVDKTHSGISAGGGACFIERCDFYNCDTSIGKLTGGYSYTTVIERCNIFFGNVGITNIIDSKVIDNYIFTNLTGVQLTTGCNACIITHNKFEWNVNNGVSVFQSANGVIGNNIFDRNGYAGLFLSSSDHMTVSNNHFMRNGADAAAQPFHDAHIYAANCTNLIFSGNMTRAMQINDNGTGAIKPENCVTLASNTDVIFKGCDLKGYVTTIFNEPFANTNVNKRDNMGTWARGLLSANGNGSNTVFTFPHGLPGSPANYDLNPVTIDASGDWYASVDATNIYLNYKVAPISGTNNVIVRWYAQL